MYGYLILIYTHTHTHTHRAINILLAHIRHRNSFRVFVRLLETLSSSFTIIVTYSIPYTQKFLRYVIFADFAVNSVRAKF